MDIKSLISNMFASLWLHFVASLSHLFFKFFCKGKCIGADIIDQEKENGFILAVNHVSYLDWMVLWGYCYGAHGIQLTFLAKEKLFKHCLFGPLMRKAGCIMVSDDGKKIIDPEGHEKLKKAKHIAIFPEGTRSMDGKVQTSKPGVIKLSKRVEKQIIPIGLKGFYETWPPNQKYPHPHPCTIAVGHPLKVLTTSTSDALDDVMNAIKTLTGESTHA